MARSSAESGALLRPGIESNESRGFGLSFQGDPGQETQRELHGIHGLSLHEMPPRDAPIPATDRQMRVNDATPVSGGPHVPLHPQQFDRLLNPVHLVGLTVPESQPQSPNHADRTEQHSRSSFQIDLAKGIHHILTIEHPYEHVLAASRNLHASLLVTRIPQEGRRLRPVRASSILACMNPGEIVRWIDERLAEAYGPVPTALDDPVETLVLTILSQNTNDTNRDRAYASLLKAFGSLNAVRGQPPEAVADAIRIGGLHRQKAQSILHALDRITKDRGTLDLSFLGERPMDEALAWLLCLPGVGKKTAGIVLLFSFDRPYFPVDTHIRRIATRIELLGERDDPHDRMNEILPSDSSLMRRLHLHLISHGRSTCKARNPSCIACTLRAVCAFGAARHGTGKGET